MARTREAVVVKPRNDAYTGFLAISFLALLAATVLMALDADELTKQKPQKITIDVPGTSVGKAGPGLERPVPAPAPGAGGDKDKGGG
ncbi:MAG TPA: hypothetical protein VKD72_24845 [Gemmataceae bacterium]|nr:hypothetical protein [Gemmataceae bacterium]